MRKKIKVKGKKEEVLVTGDKVIGATEHAYDVAAEHRGPVLAAIGALLVVVALVAGVLWFTRGRAHDAQAAFGEAAKLAERAEAGPPAATDPAAILAEPVPTWTEVATAFAKVADDHSGSPAGKLARYHAGIAQLRAGQGTEALATLSDFVVDNPRHWALPHALVALASAQEAGGDAAAAEQTLVRLRDGEWRSFPPGAALMALAQLYERQSRTDEARKIYEQLSEGKDFSDSPYASLAESRLEELS